MYLFSEPQEVFFFFGHPYLVEFFHFILSVTRPKMLGRPRKDSDYFCMYQFSDQWVLRSPSLKYHRDTSSHVWSRQLDGHFRVAEVAVSIFGTWTSTRLWGGVVGNRLSRCHCPFVCNGERPREGFLKVFEIKGRGDWLGFLVPTSFLRPFCL